MHELTNSDIEKRALMLFISYFEIQMDLVISQSKKELDKKNELNRIQGLKEKKRIDEECLKDAIKIINNITYSTNSKKGGTKQEKKNNLHLPKNTELEI
jgi:hypothetical protein